MNLQKHEEYGLHLRSISYKDMGKIWFIVYNKKYFINFNKKKHLNFNELIYISQMIHVMTFGGGIRPVWLSVST